MSVHPSLRSVEAVIGTRCMSLLSEILVLLLLSVIAGALYVARQAVRYIGADVLNIGWRLLRQGKVDWILASAVR